MIVQFVVAIVATLSFSILFQTPPKHYLFCGVVGGIGWIVYLLVLEYSGTYAFACFCSALSVTVLARMASVIRKTPVTVFLLAGIFPLVPGAGIYFTAYYLFTGDSVMAAAKGMETLIIAGTISLGILFGSAVPQNSFDSVYRILRKVRVVRG